MSPLRRTATTWLALLTLALAVVACAGTAASPSTGDGSASASTSTDFSAISCATDDPGDVGGLSGAWQGDDDGVYYIRQVGDCVWWFGTEADDIEPGVTGQAEWSNVAAGRVNGTEVVVEWADVPIGVVLGGGGLTLTYDEADDQLVITQQRGDWGFGATTLTRMDGRGIASPEASPSESASP